MLSKKRLSVQDNKIHVVEGGTGEIIGTSLGDALGTVIYVPRRHTFGRDYIVTFQEALLDIAQSDLAGHDFRVYLTVLGTSGYGTGSQLTQTQMGELLGMTKQAVNRSMKRLLDRGLVYRSDNVYYVPPKSAWKGTAKQYHTALRAGKIG